MYFRRSPFFSRELIDLHSLQVRSVDITQLFSTFILVFNRMILTINTFFMQEYFAILGVLDEVLIDLNDIGKERTNAGKKILPK